MEKVFDTQRALGGTQNLSNDNQRELSDSQGKSLESQNELSNKKRVLFDRQSAKVKILRADGVQLKGYFAGENNKSCILCFAGLGGSLGTVFSEIAEESLAQGLSFLFGNTEASYIVKDLKKVNPDGSEERVTRGGAYEHFDDTISDMLLWVKFLEEKGFENIYLVGMSLACNRLVRMIENFNNPKFKKLVLICPQDIQYQSDPEMLEEARKNVANGEGEKLLTKRIFDFCDVSGRTYLELFTDPKVNNFPYLTLEKFVFLKDFHNPVYAVIGDHDQGLENYAQVSADEVITRLKNSYNGNFLGEVLQGASHSFKGFEPLLAKMVVGFLTKI